MCVHGQCMYVCVCVCMCRVCDMPLGPRIGLSSMLSVVCAGNVYTWSVCVCACVYGMWHASGLCIWLSLMLSVVCADDVYPCMCVCACMYVYGMWHAPGPMYRLSSMLSVCVCAVDVYTWSVYVCTNSGHTYKHVCARKYIHICIYVCDSHMK